jgi:putative ABC transport system permease protein
MRLARHVPKPRSAVLRYAIGNLDRPGAATPAITIALGLGLTLFVTLALIDRNVTSALTASLPARAPAFFFLDVPDRAHEDFLRMLKDQSGTGSIESVPMLRGRIIRVKDTPADQVKPKHDGWVLSGDRGLTYADELPAGSRLVAGTWWPKDYQGPPLVSLTADAASGLGLAIGDSITVNVLGREVTAQIANLREVDWRSLGINFVMVFTPVTLKAAPHANLVTVTADPGREDAILAASAAAFPAVTAVSVREVLADVTRLLGKLILAIRGANAVTLATGVLVLTGALAGGLDTRIRDAAVLKTYGATRRQLMTAYIAEFAISGLTTAAFAMLAGGLAAWAVVSRIFELDFTFSPLTALVTALAGMGLTIASGLFVTWRALAMKPAGHLRNG